MKVIATATFLGLLATLTTLWNAQANPIKVFFAQQPVRSQPQPTSGKTVVSSPAPSPVVNPTTPAQSSGNDPRLRHDPCPACGMG